MGNEACGVEGRAHEEGERGEGDWGEKEGEDKGEEGWLDKGG